MLRERTFNTVDNHTSATDLERVACYGDAALEIVLEVISRCIVAIAREDEDDHIAMLRRAEWWKLVEGERQIEKRNDLRR